MKISEITNNQILNGTISIETETLSSTKELSSVSGGTNEAVLNGNNGVQISGEGIPLSTNDSGAIKTFEIPSGITIQSNFPMLYINNEYKEFDRISNLPATITLADPITVNLESFYGYGFERFTATINFTQQNQNNLFGLISDKSYLFVTNQWRQVRFLVQKINSNNNNDTLYVYTSDAITSNIFVGTCLVDIVNPNTSNPVEGKCLLCKDNNNHDIIKYYATQNELSVTSAELITTGTLLSLVNCQKLTFRGLKFLKNGIVDITKGVKDQSEAQVKPCISMIGCEDITFEDCEFFSIMGYCISTDEETSWNTDSSINTDIGGYGKTTKFLHIKNCYVHDSGGGGFALNSCIGSEVTGNLIKNFGLVQGCAVGILVRAAYDVEVKRNSIYNGPYSGISIGWTWEVNVNAGFTTKTRHITVENNHVHHCIQMTKNDGAGIYVLGIYSDTCPDASNRTVIRGNVVHDIVTKTGEQGSCIYLDEMCRWILTEKNICYGSDMCFQLHFGSMNEIKNNLFAYSNKRGFWISRTQVADQPDTINGFIASNNLIRIDSGSPIVFPCSAKCLFNRNLLDERGADIPLGFIDINDYMEDLFYGPLIDFLSNRINLTRTGISVIDTSYTRVNGLALMTLGSDFEPWNFNDYGIPSNSPWANYNMTSNDMSICDIRQQVCQTFSQHSSYFETT